MILGRIQPSDCDNCGASEYVIKFKIIGFHAASNPSSV